jgi:hypothetical protein
MYFFFPKTNLSSHPQFFLTKLRALIFTSMAGSGPHFNRWLAGWLACSVDNSNIPHVFYIEMDGTSPCSLVYLTHCHEPKAY